MEEVPCRQKKWRICPIKSSQCTENESFNQPKRRSQRTLSLLKIGDYHLPRKRIPVGPSFQADVPDWTGSLSINKQCSDKEDVDDLKWLGAHVWPTKGSGTETNEGVEQVPPAPSRFPVQRVAPPAEEVFTADVVDIPTTIMPKCIEKIGPPPEVAEQAAERANLVDTINESSYLYDGKSKRNGQMTLFNEKQKESADLHHPWQQANGYFSHGRGTWYKTEESLEKNPRLADKERRSNRSGNKSQMSSDYALENDDLERSSMPILGCNSLSKKRKGKDGNEYLDERNDPVHCQSNAKRRSECSPAVKKAKRKGEVEAMATSAKIPEPAIPEKVASELEMDTKTQKKSFTLITPTIHTDFSFSIIHLLSAVRKALITAQMEGTEDIDNHLRKDDVSMLGESNLPSLTVQEIVNLVRSNPGDPCILETPELLQDLVRGVMKIFSSKTAPLGAKGWKVLVVYEKSNKSWSWVGPVPSSSSDNDNAEEETSAEAWGVPYKMLVKLVDAFANWLKSGQETLQQIGSLPPPPAMLPVLDDKDRFRDLRAQKSLNTISPSSEEVRAYFHKEELLRYSIPDRAFQYTAADGRKSIVAPLRRGGGKPTSKARDHFMLRPDRPPHVTILCLVRDAAARLPGSIGTRADVCTLIKDSQYIVEDVTDAQVNQVVSGALDRLHYERDPCVQFDGERKLWVYLHRDREEEDFEDDGTSSTKKWKRQKKDVTEHSEMAGMNESNTGEAAADHNIDSSAANMAGELVYNDLRPNRENVQSYVNPDSGDRNPISWGLLGENPLQENKMICQENSTNKDFDDEAFNRGRPVGLLSASLF